MTEPIDAAVALLIATAINLAILARVGLREPDERSFLIKTYLWTLALRMVLAFTLNALASNSAIADMFWGDSSAYDLGGDLLARRWQGEAVAPIAFVSGQGFLTFVGVLYYLFGRNQLLVQLVNATIGSVTMLVLYAIARQLFGRAVARWTALFMAFFPQMVFWSGGMYKDPATLLSIALCMYAVLMLRERISLKRVLLFVGAALVLLTLRFYVFYFVVGAAVGTFVFGGRGRLAQRLVSFALLVTVLVAGLRLGVRQETIELQAAFMTLEQAQVTRKDQAAMGRSAFGGEHDVSSLSGALQALPQGLVYLLFAPFPWAISGIRQLMTLPETLVWYALMPAFVRGILYGIRNKLSEILPIIVFTVMLTGAYALTQGNVGTAYRQRTQITMFFFVFMGVGLAKKHQVFVSRPDAEPGRGPSHSTEPAIVDRDFVYSEEPDPERPPGR